MRKKFLCLGLVALLSATQVVSVFADREADLKEKKAATSSQLESTNSTIANLEEKTAQLQEEIDQADAQLVDVLVAIDILKEELIIKEADIVKTKEDLKVAEADKDKQYADMKLRIQYIYENGGDAAWAQMLLEAEDVSSLLNKAEYTQQLYEYDRKSLENYVAVVKEVTELGQKLESEKADLEVMKADQEVQQGELETVLAEKKEASSDYENQIAVAEEQAQEYKALIQEQTEEINAIQAEKARAAEEAARKKAEEAAKKKAARKAAAQEESSNNESSESGSSSSSESGSTESSSSESSDNTSSESDSSNESSSEESSSVSYSGNGSAVVDYALGFLGAPYVYGGESLSTGIDCSAFTQAMFAHFGVSLPRSSGEQRYAGVEVPYSQAQPGDLICYSGHVAIYMGGGAIVHASNPSDGVKTSPNAAYRAILSVRRVI